VHHSFIGMARLAQWSVGSLLATKVRFDTATIAVRIVTASSCHVLELMGPRFGFSQLLEPAYRSTVRGHISRR
jgi:hypothetical protein